MLLHLPRNLYTTHQQCWSMITQHQKQYTAMWCAIEEFRKCPCSAISQTPRLCGDYLVIKVSIKSLHAQTRAKDCLHGNSKVLQWIQDFCFESWKVINQPLTPATKGVSFNSLQKDTISVQGSAQQLPKPRFPASTGTVTKPRLSKAGADKSAHTSERKELPGKAGGEPSCLSVCLSLSLTWRVVPGHRC